MSHQVIVDYLDDYLPPTPTTKYMQILAQLTMLIESMLSHTDMYKVPYTGAVATFVPPV
jgi:hypothetical protein